MSSIFRIACDVGDDARSRRLILIFLGAPSCPLWLKVFSNYGNCSYASSRVRTMTRFGREDSARSLNLLTICTSAGEGVTTMCIVFWSYRLGAEAMAARVALEILASVTALKSTISLYFGL